MSPLKRRALLARLCVLSTLAILIASCQTTASGEKTDATRVACLSFTPIYWLPDDTPETIIQVKQHNAAWSALCGKQNGNLK